MKRIVIGLCLMTVSLMAELYQVWATPEFAEKNMKIIDIRTPAEWRETGIVKGSYTIMFFDEKGNFNVPDFLEQLERVVKKDEPFALICRVGSRTGIVSEFLSERLGYKVTNLKGGIMKMIHEGYKTVPYQP
ncbi:rhodanese-like domain-containing protein [Sulfurovum sp. XGS-02]|uniref:rhodanese-like domain-containing protein n=1 Tax=Sulfurovum sp. XGS-02 TaxID=2925411 RepID=UPI002065AB4D|nr:rhodanese-like domain-containing protein [Sulfurovum sp. XGS-02]UPT76799.1 rhodanese-like domain-containing protein [Sulfurovum sp. XGS-02]